MNYFSTQRLTIWSIIILVLLNIFTMATFWFFQFRQPQTTPQGGQSEQAGQSRQSRQLRQPGQPGNVRNFLQEELDLTDEQARQFEELRQQHFEQSKVIADANQQLKRALMEEVFAAVPDTAKMQELAGEIGAKQTEIETLRFNHFLELKALCQPEQLEKFQALFYEILPPTNPPQPGRQPQAGRPPQPGGLQEPGRPPEAGRQPGHQGQGRPPQEAIDACRGKNQGNSCQFTSPHGAITGTCRSIGNQLACAPEGGPPGGQSGRPPGPPPGGQNRQ